MGSGRARLDRTMVQGFYDRMRAVAPAAYGAMERDRAGDPGRAFRDTACGRLVASLDAAGLRALGMWAHHWCMRFYDDDTRVGLRLVREIASRPGLGWTADEVRWMLGESESESGSRSESQSQPGSGSGPRSEPGSGAAPRSQVTGPSAVHRFTLPAAAVRELPPAARREFAAIEPSGAGGRETTSGPGVEGRRLLAG
ncbi:MULTISPECIES: hypothetical protein [unclassified Micromonospora]|uniref:hypothetical protein n=1 Tax=unclassified Micromonospora TaxID=2617518 RepID=UPI003635519E